MGAETVNEGPATTFIILELAIDAHPPVEVSVIVAFPLNEGLGT